MNRWTVAISNSPLLLRDRGQKYSWHSTTYCYWIVVGAPFTAPLQQATGWSSPPTSWRSDHTRPWLKHPEPTPPAQKLAGWSSVIHKKTGRDMQGNQSARHRWGKNRRLWGTSSPLAVSFLWVSASFSAEPSTLSSCKTKTTCALSAAGFVHIWAFSESSGRLWPS